ncbi:unnamed protein product [Owenia fusiformis]|uniref:Tyrosine-protein kinase BAZ1B n=1 Tax=Owenia fusiformis TaxID=6347 RepID=A0A8J1XW34_OWEFU|nr:unnamed protein product [Owenia fusiformis]
MPLLGRKIFQLKPPLEDAKPEETLYTIKHTQEQFKSKSEYERRLALYKDKVWTCRCTGHINMSHADAWKSELRIQKMLKSEFSSLFEEPILRIMHHSTLVLEGLVEKCWLHILQSFVVGEPIVLNVKDSDDELDGVILKVDTTIAPGNPSNSGSPSSDKENAENKEATGSEAGSPTKKWSPPKLLPYKYSLKIDDGRIIHGVPALDLQRTTRTPSKELMRYFIRTNATRAGETQKGPWVVDDKLVKKFDIPAKLSDFFLSPTKVSETSKKSESSKKRKPSTKLKSPAAKKAKKDTKSKSTESPKKSPKKTPKGKSPKNGSLIAASKDDSDSDDEDNYVLADLKALKKAIAEQGKSSPGKNCSKNTPKKSTSKKGNGDTSAKGTPRKSASNSKSNTPRKETNEKTPKKKKDKDGKKKSLKQMTLFDMSNKTDSKSPGRSPALKKSKVMSPPRLPSLALKLRKAMAAGDDKWLIGSLMYKCAKELTNSQRKNLPDDLRGPVQEKWEVMEEKKKIKAMPAAEREEYLKKKKEEKMKKSLEARKEKMAEMKKLREESNKKFEDTELGDDLPALPAPKLVPTPEGLPNECFGDVAMVTEFISCYKGLLMPDDEYPIMSDALMKALCNGKEGYTYLGRVCTVLLSTLLQDQISNDYKELDFKLSELPVTAGTASELLRLVLRSHDIEDKEDDESDASEELENEENEVPEEVIEQLESCEFFDLEPEQKLQILLGLCHRMLGSYSVQDFLNESQQEASNLWKQKIKFLKEKNDKLRQEKKIKQEVKKEETGGATDNPDKEKESKSKKGKVKEEVKQEEPEDEEPADLASVVKRRRITTAKAAEERAKKEEEERIQRDKREEEYRKQKEKVAFDKTFTEGIACAKLVLRQTPIGTDRNHSRYWIFQNTTPGLFVEKGWATKDFQYSVETPKTTDVEDSDDEVLIKKVKKLKEGEETTSPHFGQNLWFTYDSIKDLDSLLQGLSKNGIRESVLKEEIKKSYDAIKNAIYVAQRTNVALRDSDGNQEALKNFKEGLLSFELIARQGGLGGLPTTAEFNKWEKKLEKTDNVKELGELMVVVMENILPKFLQNKFAKKKKKVNKFTTVEVKEEELGEGEEEKDDKEQIKVDETIAKWKEASRNCSTMSRLHVLLGMFESCVNWNMSSENAKCKICRKGGNDDKLLLCDDCNLAFHLYCLRPALPAIPKGEWFCPACIPLSKRRCTRGINYKNLNDGSDEEEQDEEEMAKDEECHICGDQQNIFSCSSCPRAFHLDCHEPPLRHPPRSTWTCTQCKTGVQYRRPRRSKTQQRKAAQSRKRYEKEESSSEEEEEEESDAGSDIEVDSDASDVSLEVKVRPARGTRNSRRANGEDEDLEKALEESKRSSRRQSKGNESVGDSSRSARATRRALNTSSDDTDNYVPNKKSKSNVTKKQGTPTEKRKAGRPSKSKKAQNDLLNGITWSESDDEDTEESDVAVEKKDPAMKACTDILQRVIRHRHSWPFRQPVDVKIVPDYYDVITDPLDLTTIKNRCLCFEYSTPVEFLGDMDKIFQNSYIYNGTASEIGGLTKQVEEFYKQLVEKFLPDFMDPLEKQPEWKSDHSYSSPPRPKKKVSD